MEELLDRQDQNKLVDLIESSGLCSSNSDRREFIKAIGLRPQDIYVEKAENTFLLDLIYELDRRGNTESLRLICQKLSKKLSGFSNHEELRHLEAQLGKSSRNYKPSQPKARPAYFVDNRVFPLMPLDIGTIWGLQRSSFIGILAGFEQDEIYETLRNVEFVLSEEVKANGCARLPKREWIQLDLSKSDGIPYNNSDILDVAVNFSGEAAKSLNENDFPPLSIPGFLFKINYKELKDYLQTIQNWCKALLGDLFSSSESVAIVIDITYSSDENIPQSVQDITHSLQDIKSKLIKVCGQIPIELMHLDYRLFFKHKNESYLEPESNNFSIRDLKPGFLFCRWIYQELIKCGYSQNHSYKDIIQLYEQLKNQYSEEELQKCCGSITAIDVVLDIKAITSEDKVTKIYEKLLRFILKYNKIKCIHEWVRDYVKSEVLEAVRAALVVISEADLLSDTLMDVWVDAIDFDKFDFNLFCQNGILNPDVDSTRNNRLEKLVLALLQKYNQRHDSLIKTIIDDLVVSYPTLQDFNNFCQNTKEQEDSFLCKNDAKQFEFALRANIKLEKAIEKFKAAPVSYVPTAICWLLAASPPTKSSISEILLLDPKKRAIFGLCTPQEWQKIKKRQDKERQVLDCRRKRPLIYSYSL
ncbi:MAG: hypothetical protein F6K56_04865 [Moorea sp. SIO3G5]|nr:hypothetical protein [Moorena sp. SIO3G5]